VVGKKKVSTYYKYRRKQLRKKATDRKPRKHIETRKKKKKKIKESRCTAHTKNNSNPTDLENDPKTILREYSHPS